MKLIKAALIVFFSASGIAHASSTYFAKLGKTAKKGCVFALEDIETIKTSKVTIDPLEKASVCYGVDSGQISGIAINRAEVTTKSNRFKTDFYFSIGIDESQCESRLMKSSTRMKGSLDIAIAGKHIKGLVATKGGEKLEYLDDDFVCFKLK